MPPIKLKSLKLIIRHKMWQQCTLEGHFIIRKNIPQRWVTQIVYGQHGLNCEGHRSLLQTFCKVTVAYQIFLSAADNLSMLAESSKLIRSRRVKIKMIKSGSTISLSLTHPNEPVVSGQTGKYQYSHLTILASKFFKYLYDGLSWGT